METKQENQNSTVFPLKGFFMFKITLADAVSVVLGVLSASSQTFSAIALPVAPKRTNFPWWFCPLHNPQEQPLINGWQAWRYKCSHHFPLMNNAEMWPSPSSNHLCSVLLPYLVLFSFLPHFLTLLVIFSWEHSLMCPFPMGIPCLRICFQGKHKWKTTNSVIIRIIIIYLLLLL